MKYNNSNKKIFREYMVKKYGNLCFYCKGKILNSNDIHLDHYIPQSLGGSNDEENIRISCSKCNIEKSNFLPTEYFEFLLEKEEKFEIKYEYYLKELKRIRKVKETLNDNIDCF